MSEPRLEELARLLRIVDRLRAEDGCPWDREQTLESMIPCALEEAAEVADAVASGSMEDSCEELGDLLMNVFLMSRIAEQDGAFSMAEVARGIADKLIRRHPHVFGDTKVDDSVAVVSHWERIKKEEKPQARLSRMDELPSGLPPLAAAAKRVDRAASVGFVWPSASAAWEKVEEELEELRAASVDDHATGEEEVGDVLFALVAWCRHRSIDADLALRRANQKFERRFRDVEAQVQDPRESSLDELLAAWERAKGRELRR